MHQQILNPNKNPQVDPKTGKDVTSMPADLLTGQDAYDVAAYVAAVAAKPGKDTGLLATVGGGGPRAPRPPRTALLAIPADPTGQLFYVFKDATAPAGQIKIESQNKSAVDHDISLEGNGVDENGQVVKNGGTSEVDVDLKPGTYTFYCSVPGHREAGMEGKLTVK